MFSFPNLEPVHCSMSSSNCCFLTCIRFPRRQVKWPGISHFLKSFPQFVVIHTVKGFSIVNEAEVDVFLELSCFFHDPVDVGNLISGSSAFSKPSLYIWKLSIHKVLKPSLNNFERNFTSMWNVQLYSSLNILWYCPSLGLELKLIFSSLVATAEFKIYWHIERSTITA